MYRVSDSYGIKDVFRRPVVVSGKVWYAKDPYVDAYQQVRIWKMDN